MAGTNEVILQKTLAAIEVTRGTQIATTRKVYGQITGTYVRPLTFFRNATGTYEGRRRASYAREKITFTNVDEATYEDLPWWAQQGLKGGVAGVADAGAVPAPSYLYTFVPSLSTDDLKSICIEFNEAGNPYLSNQVMMDTMTLRMDADNDAEPSWMIDSSHLGRGWTSGAYTAAIPERVTEPILARGTKLYIDDTTIGTTQVLGKFISCSITVNNQIHFKAFAEDAVGVAANKVGRQERMVDAQFTFEFDDDVEFAKYRSTTAVERKIRIHQEGSQVHSDVPTITGNKYMNIDLYGFWSSWAGNNRAGNLTATFGFSASYDATATKSFALAVNNALATLV